MQALVQRMRDAASGDELIAAALELDACHRHFDTQGVLCEIRNTVDTTDAFYKAEQDEWDVQRARFAEIPTTAAEAVLDSPHRDAYAARFGEHLLEKYAVRRRTFRPEIVDDLAEENRLGSEYRDLMSSAKIDFEGEVRNLSAITPFTQSPDRELRRRAMHAAWGWIASHGVELDDLYARLVAVRQRMAAALGFENFVGLAYARMGRTDWDQADAKAYRDQIASAVVPLAQKLYREQAARIGIDPLKNYDLPLAFLSGNPKPQGDEPFMVERAGTMYDELSTETSAFFGQLTSQQLMDLTTKPGKAPGGYMTWLADYKVPFIFSNFNGTAADVDVLTHEAGHAFQGWLKRDVELLDQAEPTMEVAEIHSMSMEFFTHPWMAGFFGDQTEKYHYSHVVDAILFLPYAASIDEFQEWVYEHPEATPAERHEQYRALERKYLPHLDYDGFEFLERGARWQRQLHVYQMPFYYLDYALSQVCALQYLVWDQTDHDAAWRSYLTLCEQSGAVPFKRLVPASGLRSPFEDGSIAEIIAGVERYLDTLDRSQLV